MNARGVIKIGAISGVVVVFMLVLFLLVLPLFGSAILEKKVYILGEKVKIDLNEYCRVKIITPSTSYIVEVKDKIIFEPEEIGKYKIILNANGKTEVYEFEVVGSLEKLGEEPKNDTENNGRNLLNASQGKNFKKAEIVSEQKISRGKKQVRVRALRNISEVAIASASVDEITRDKRNIKVYWKEQNKDVEFEARDEDNDGLIDKVEWIVKGEGEQTFEIIIITKALHLNETRGVLGDIYEEVKEKDGVWVAIPSEHFVRASFEKNLTKENDITLYARGNGRVEVYEKDGLEKIAEFQNIGEENWHKVFLTELQGQQDTFDLRVFGDIEFDYIVDPAVTTNVGATTATAYGWEDNIVKLDNGELIAVWTDVNSDLWCSNSSDGYYWSHTEIADAVSYFTSTIATNGSRILVLVEDTTQDDIMSAYSDSGCSGAFTFLDIPNFGDVGVPAMGYPAVATGPDGVYHICAIAGADDLYYLNSGDGASFSTNVTVDATDVDVCDIAVDIDNNVFIAKTGWSGDDIEIVNSTTAFASATTRVIDNVNPNANPYVSIAIGNNNEVYVSYTYSLNNAFYFANSTNQIDWSYKSVATDSSYVGDTLYSVLKVNNDTGEIYVFYDQDINSAEYAVFYANSLDNGVSWSNSLFDYGLYGGITTDDAWYVNVRGSKYPVSNRITDSVDLIYTSWFNSSGSNKVVFNSIYNLDYSSSEGIFVSSSQFNTLVNRTVMKILEQDNKISRRLAPVGTDSGSQRYWNKVRCMEKRQECILMWDDADTNTSIEFFNTNTGAWSGYVELANAEDSATPRFDVECEDESGECLIVYDNGPDAGADTNISYRVYSTSGVLGGGSILNFAPTLNDQDWLKLYPKPGTNEIMFVMQDEAEDITAILWNGTSNSFLTSTRQVITQASPAGDRKSFDFSWEGDSGEGILFYGVLGNYNLSAYTFNSSYNWTNIGNVTHLSGASYVISSCGAETSGGTNHNYVGVIVQTFDGVQVNTHALMWNGTAIETGYPTQDLVSEGFTATENIDCSWETASKNEAVFLWTDVDALTASGGSYKIGTGWSFNDLSNSPAIGSVTFSDDIDSLSIISNPLNDEMMIIGQDVLEDVNCFNWNGTGFNNQTCTNYFPLESMARDSATASESFDYFRFDTTIPLVTIISPLNQIYNVSIININFSLNEAGTCNYSFNAGINNISMTADTSQKYFNATNSSIADGSYIASAYCQDMAGNKNNSESRNFQIDTSFPLIGYSPGTEDSEVNKSRNWIYVNVSVTELNEANIIFGLYNNEGEINISLYTDFARDINWTDLEDDVYYYNVTICDLTNKCNSTETRIIRLDDTAPVINIIYPEPRTYTTNVSLPLNYTVSDNLIGLSSCWWNLNNGNNHTLECGQNTTFNASIDGSYTMYFYSNDSLNNIEMQSVVFFVSTDAPAITLEHPEQEAYLNYSNNINFDYTPRDKQGLDTCKLWGNWSSGWHLNQTDNSVENYSVNSFNLSYLGEGDYVWDIWCNDTTGAAAFSPENYTFAIDLTFPLISFGYGTEDSGVNRSRNWVYVNVSVAETNEANITFYLYNTTGGLTLVNETTFFNEERTVNWTNLQDGIYYYNVSIYDKANNRNSTETRQITLDTILPNGTLIAPSNATYTSNLTQNFTVDVSDEQGLSNATLYIYNETGSLIYEATETLKGATTAIAGLVYTFLYDGIFKWFYKIVDIAGNYFLTQNNTITIDTTFPLVNFTFPTESSGAEFERQWIFVNVSVNETNFANITFYLFNFSGEINRSFFSDLTNITNWTGLSNANVTYYYNVSVSDLAGNINTTETRTIKLYDNTIPSLSLAKPLSRIYYTRNISIEYLAGDLNLQSCWYNLNNGGNITLENCYNSSVILEDGEHFLRIFANDSLGLVSEQHISFNVSVNNLKPGILAYGELNSPIPKYRFWNGYEFSEELSANSVGGTIEWVIAKSSPVRDEHILAVTNNSDAVVIQVNSSLGGQSCWHNGISCNNNFIATKTSSTLDYQKIDVAYETLSGNAVIVWAENNQAGNYTVWNGTGFNGINALPQTLLSGTIRFFKMESHPLRDEIALIMSNATNLNILIWNGTGWGCEPSSLIETPIEAGQVYQVADLAYEQVSGDLFVASTDNGYTGFDYITKLDQSCDYTRVQSNSVAKEAEIIDISSEYGSDYILISIEDIGDNDMDNIVWNGTFILAGSNTEASVTAEGSPNLIMANAWAGTNGTGFVFYSDADASTTLDYFYYNKHSNSWSDNAGVGYNVVGLTPFNWYERNIMAFSYPVINRTMIIVEEQSRTLWVKGYDADYNEWLDIDQGVEVELNLPAVNIPEFSFYFDNDIAGPAITINNPGRYISYTDILFNITTGESASCSYILDEGPSVNMDTLDNKTFTDSNDSLEEGEHNATFLCQDEFGNLRVYEHIFIIDFSYPLISFGDGTEQNNSVFERDWIYVNVSVNETNFANITYELYNDTNGRTLVNRTIYTSLILIINWTNLNWGIYYYNVSVYDKVGNFNYTETRTINLTRIAPIVNLVYPFNGANLSSYAIEFNYSVFDNSSLVNCSLYGNWSGWHLNQTTNNPSNNISIEQNFSSVNVGGDGYYIWNVECIDVYGNVGWNASNFSFAAFLFPEAPSSQYFNISQTINDGTGNITLFWNSSNHSTKYRIYYSNNLTSFVYLNETSALNFTDTTFSGQKRRFYRVDSWNPAGQNGSLDYFGAHVYTLQQNMNTRNWLGFPTNFSYLINANNTLYEIRNVTAFTMWNETTQKRITCNRFSCPDTFECTDTNCNFNLQQGRGYEVNVNSSAPSTINWSGVGIVYNKTTINLVKNTTNFGKNWIEIYANTSLRNASGLLTSISKADAVTRWNSALQKSEGLIYSPFPWVPYIGTNFNITVEEAYEVSVNTTGNWERA